MKSLFTLLTLSMALVIVTGCMLSSNEESLQEEVESEVSQEDVMENEQEEDLEEEGDEDDSTEAEEETTDETTEEGGNEETEEDSETDTEETEAVQEEAEDDGPQERINERPSVIDVVEPGGTYTLEEVSLHRSRLDCWVVVENAVYNITQLVNDSRTNNTTKEYCGGDAAEHFTVNGAIDTSSIEGYNIGTLGQEEEQEEE